MDSQITEIDNLPEDQENGPKQRHGCVTAWLYLMIVANAFTSVIFLFMGNEIAQDISGGAGKGAILLLAVIGISNIIFAIMLLRWRKIGFWGFTITSAVAFGVNIYMGGGVGQSILGLLSLGILYAILQIKKNDTPAWNHLD